MRKNQGEDVTIQGYIVGVPTQVNHVQQQTFSSDYALALADHPDEDMIDEMIFVQLDSEYRHQFGLETNPDLIGDFIVVTGVKEDYFSHDGIKQVTQLKAKQSDPESEKEKEKEKKKHPRTIMRVFKSCKGKN